MSTIFTANTRYRAENHANQPNRLRPWPGVTAVLALAAVWGMWSATGWAQTAPSGAFPMNVMQDSATFALYVNEEPLVTGHCDWQASGAFSSDYSVSMAGQTVTTTLKIDVDDKGQWTAMTMNAPTGQVTVTRADSIATITAMGKSKTVPINAGTILFENFSPALMSHAVVAYDQKAGGKQTMPMFIVPAAVMDATLERLDTVTRTVGGKPQTFTTYQFGLPGVDVTLWVDEGNRVCFGDVPAQHAAYVRTGYETLLKKEAVDSTVSQAEYEIVVDTGVGVPMRDGIKLATDIYRPKADGQYPIVLIRTPYKKEMRELQGKFYARRGYVCAIQDCRGRFASEGTWNPFFDEPNDGYDAVEWLAAQPWSNGRVGMIGASYEGWVQWWAARNHPPHLVTIIPNVSPPDPYFNIPYEYGSFFLLGAIWWANILEQEATADLSGKAMLDINEKEYHKLLRHLPVIDLDSIIMGKKNSYWRDWIAHPDNDAYWDRASFLPYLGELDIPVYHQSGWYDGDGIGSKLNYLKMTSHGHKYQKLVLGPWGHTDKPTRMGPLLTDFGPEAIVDLETSYVRWLDRWLRGVDNGIDKEPLVSVFVMGSNKWLHGDAYPLPETQFTKFYLAGNGNANTAQGDGRLTTDLPADAGTAFDKYAYDPGDPTPDPSMYYDLDKPIDDTTSDSGKVESAEAVKVKHRAFYNRIDNEREDILVYETGPMEKPLTFAGPISAVLYAASSAKDTDWHMRLTMIQEDGNVYPLVHGVLRARYRDSFAEPELLKPGEVYEYRIDMWQTGITVPVGARLRVEVASASFPMFSRNLNTGGHNETETEFTTAEQTIYHDQQHPSHVLLPVIPDAFTETRPK